MDREKKFFSRRWLSVALRSLHLAGVVLVALAVFGNGKHSYAGAALMLASGAGLYAIELWQHARFWAELAGVFVAVKLLAVLAMLLLPDFAGLLFWLVLIGSGLISHAPRLFRHRRILG